MLLCVWLQSLASLSVEMDWWKQENSVTVATATSVKTPAAIAPMKQRAKDADSNLEKSAGQIYMPLHDVLCIEEWFSIKDTVKGFLEIWLHKFHTFSTVPAKALVAHQSVHSRAVRQSADKSLIVLKKALATGPQLCVLPQNQRKTSPPAIQRHKSASTGYFGHTFLFAVHVWILSLCFSSNVFDISSFCPSVFDRFALVQFVKSMDWRSAHVPARMARMKLLSSAMCAAWRKVSDGLKKCSWI